MSLGDELETEISDIFKNKWSTRDGDSVPTPEDIGLSGNDGVNIDAVVLYADMVESTSLVDKKKSQFAAEVYKAFLVGACRTIRANGGYIRAFDGDRVMAIFVGSKKNSSAAKSALQINYVVKKLINPELKKIYPNTDYVLNHVVGVDSGSILVARTGIKGSNDLVWVGRAANYAAKLCSLREEGYSSYIAKSVYENMIDNSKYSHDGRPMWESRTWSQYNSTIYRSGWTWPVK